jgi:molecular chaperone GrpE
MMKNEDKNKVEETTNDTGNEQYQELENKYKRALADYQNLEKRVREERVGLIKLANRELLLRLLPILYTLLLAQQHSNDQSLAVSIQQFLDALKDEGAAKIETIGKEFDPALMEAVGTETGEEGLVLKETRAGFILHEKLLRPAQVIVGSK